MMKKVQRGFTLIETDDRRGDHRHLAAIAIPAYQDYHRSVRR